MGSAIATVQVDDVRVRVIGMGIRAGHRHRISYTRHGLRRDPDGLWHTHHCGR